MEETLYAIEWRRYYSEYDICYISRSREQAQKAMKIFRETYDLDFKIIEFPVDQPLEIWGE